MSSFKKFDIDPDCYLEVAKYRAKRAGYNPDLLELSDNPTYKLEYNGTPFGRHGYGDYIIYRILAYQKRDGITREYAEQKRDAYQKSHSKIKGEWDEDPESPNMLSLKINW